VETPLSARVLDSNSNDFWDTARSVIAVGALGVYYCLCSLSWQTPRLRSLSDYRAPLHAPSIWFCPPAGILVLLDRDPHASVMLCHGNEHVMVVCQILICCILETHVRDDA
jgi:hypothetical protein